jgi:hypothetical protein
MFSQLASRHNSLLSRSGWRQPRPARPAASRQATQDSASAARGSPNRSVAVALPMPTADPFSRSCQACRRKNQPRNGRVGSCDSRFNPSYPFYFGLSGFLVIARYDLVLPARPRYPWCLLPFDVAGKKEMLMSGSPNPRRRRSFVLLALDYPTDLNSGLFSLFRM